MATNHINLFATEYGLESYKSRYFGVYNGYNVCLGYEGSNIVYFFNTQIEECDSFLKILEHNAQDYDIVRYRITSPIVSVVSRNKNIKQVMDYLTALLKMCNASGAEICAFCGQELGTKPTYFDVDGVVCIGHEKCYNKFNYMVNKRVIDVKYAEVPVSKAIVLPLFIQMLWLVLICIVYIATKSFSWFYYIFGGLMMGYTSAFFYTRLRGRSGVPYYASLLSNALVCMFLAQAVMQAYLIIGDYSFFMGLNIFFVSWLNSAAVVEMLLPQLALGMISVLIGLVFVDYRRIVYLKDNAVKISRISR